MFSVHVVIKFQGGNYVRGISWEPLLCIMPWEERKGKEREGGEGRGGKGRQEVKNNLFLTKKM